jgi:hypothetical protein
MVAQLPNGQIDQLYFDSGINNPGHTGEFFAPTLQNLAVPGWSVVDGGQVAHELLPVI